MSLTRHAYPPQIEWDGHESRCEVKNGKGLRRPRVVSPGNAGDRSGTIPYRLSFSACPSSAVDFQTRAIEDGQLSKQVWKVDTRAARQVSAESPQFQKVAGAWPIEVPTQARPIP